MMDYLHTASAARVPLAKVFCGDRQSYLDSRRLPGRDRDQPDQCRRECRADQVLLATPTSRSAFIASQPRTSSSLACRLLLVTAGLLVGLALVQSRVT